MNRQRLARTLAPVILAAALMAPAGPPLGSEAAHAASSGVYENPVLGGMEAADPFVFPAGDSFLAFTSSATAGGLGLGQLLPVYGSPDGVQGWRLLGDALAGSDLPGWVDPSATPAVQGPSVLKRIATGTGPPSERMRYLLYFAGAHRGSGERCVGVLASSDARGRVAGAPFADATPDGEPLVCGATDPSAYARSAWGAPSPAEGRGPAWLLYAAPVEGASTLEQEPDEIRALPLDEDGLPAGQSDVLLSAELTWERGVVSGPSLVPDPESGRLLLFFAGGPRDADRHSINWAICFEEDVGIECPSRGQGDPWMGRLETSQVEPVQAPGAPAPYRAADGHLWIAYDAVREGACASANAADTCTGLRTSHIDKVCTRQGQPRTNGPSSGQQPVERQADCRSDIPLQHPQGGAWPEADALFKRHEQFRGADGALSVLLDEDQERILWYFGDSFIDLEPPFERRGSFFVNNTVAIQQGFDPETAEVEFFWTMGEGRPQAIFRPETPGSLYWPSGGAVVGDGSRSILVNALPERDAQLNRVGVSWGLVENYADRPDEWEITYVPQPPVAEAFGFDGEPTYMGIEAEGDYLHAYAHDRPSGFSDGPAYRVRWAIEDVLAGDFSRFEWRDGDEWRRLDEFEGSPPQRTFATNAPQWSIHSERSDLGGYTLIDQGAFLGPMRWDNAPTRDGPWDEERPFIFDAPERYWEGILVYANWAAPEIVGADLVAMYSQNGGTEPFQAFRDERYYYPRFVRILYE